MTLPFDESRFRQQVQTTLGKIQTILDNTRSPTYAADVPHEYADKYGLSEFIVNTAVAASLETLSQMGLTAAGMQQLIGWARDRSVTLRLSASEHCSYLREVSRKVESASHVTESSLFGKSTSKVVTTVVEHFWQFDAEWSLTAFVGTGSGAGERVQLAQRSSRCEIMTSAKTTPQPTSRVQPMIDVNITWLLQQTTDAVQPRFTIARESARTPRRNAQADAALSFFSSLHSWAGRVHRYFLHTLFPIHASHGLDLTAINDSALFVPVVALMEKGRKGPPVPPFPPIAAGAAPRALEEGKEDAVVVSASGSPSPVPPSSALVPAGFGSSLLPVGDVNRFLAEQRRTLQDKSAELARVFPTPAAGKLLSSLEASVCVVCLHAQRVAQAAADGLDYIELMLRRQLIAAVGRELTSLDFANYMRFHYRKMYRPEFEPRPFSFAVRRPEHYPEGTLSIESTSPGDGVAGQTAEPILTCVRQVTPAFPMHFPLSASTNVVFRGERYLHGWVGQQFAGQSNLSVTLNARARQFSCFLVLVGTLGSASLFQPKHAFLVKDKDDWSLPLLLEQLPTAKEFRDAIESLSPEQQRFAKAIRSMQLEGSLFGVCVVQLKPQLEKLLRLPDDSLTKEIQLTQQLLELFIKYQIPSDLLSYDGEAGASTANKLAKVKQLVANMYDMIRQAKDKESAEMREQASYAVNRLVADECEKSESCDDYDGAPCIDVVERSYKKKSKSVSLFSFSSRSTKESCADMAAAPMPSKASKGGAAEGGRGGGGVRREAATGGRARDAGPPMAGKSAARTSTSTSSSSSSLSTPPANTAVAKPPAAVPQQHQQAQPQGEPESTESGGELEESDVAEPIDWTQLPVSLDKKLAELDEDSALRPTIISVGGTWTKRQQKSLLASPQTSTLGADEQALAKQEAFDLLDALSRSGSLSLDACALHIVLATTHCFSDSLIDTVIQRNINPIEKLERSSLLVASTVQAQQPAAMLKPEVRERVQLYSSKLFLEAPSEEEHALLAAGEEKKDEA